MNNELENKVKILIGEPNYLLVDELLTLLTKQEIECLIKGIIETGKLKQIKNVIFKLRHNNSQYDTLKEDLLNFGFQKSNKTSVLVRKELDFLEQIQTEFLDFRDLNQISEEEFKTIWFRSVEDTPEESTIESISEQFESMKNEIGLQYRTTCIGVFHKEEKKAIGVITPMIEPGTANEGRLFYTGLVKSERGKGYGDILFKKSMEYLKKFGATYAIDSTDESNKALLKIFEKNKCQIIDQEDVFFLSLT